MQIVSSQQQAPLKVYECTFCAGISDACCFFLDWHTPPGMLHGDDGIPQRELTFSSAYRLIVRWGFKNNYSEPKQQIFLQKQ